jgi:hypothetical protein
MLMSKENGSGIGLNDPRQLRTKPEDGARPEPKQTADTDWLRYVSVALIIGSICLALKYVFG